MFTLFRLLLIRNWRSLATLSIVIFFASTAFLVMRLLTTNIENSVATETKPLFGADFKISYEGPPPESLTETFSKYLSGYDYTIAEVREFSSTLFSTDGKPGLVNIIAYSGSYPQAGILETIEMKNEGRGENSGEGQKVSASDDLIAKYSSGGNIIIDGRTIEITDRIVKSSDLGLGFGGDNALLILPIDLLSGSSLISSGSRLDADLFVSFADPSDAEKVKISIDEEAYKEYRIRTYADRSESSLETTRELTDYILLIIFISSVFAAIIMRSAHDRLMSSLDRTIRIIEMLGCTRRRQFLLFSGMYIIIIPIALILAYFASMWILSLVRSLPGAESFIFMASVIPWTLAMIGLLLFTAFFPYWWSRTGYTLSYRGRDLLVPLVLVGGFVLSLYLIFDDIVFSLLLGVGLLTGTGVLFFILSLLYRLIYRSLSSQREKRFALYDALRTHVRPLTPTLPITLSLTIITSVMVVFLLFSLSFRAKLVLDTSETANIYAINILESDREKVSTYLSGAGSEFYSIIRARISKINGESLEKHLGVEKASGEFTREFNITTSSLSNPIQRGKEKIGKGEVSVDEDFALRLGVDLGDRVTFLLSGRDITLTIANIRKSEREGFSPFFYFSFDPIEFERAPKTYMATAYTTDAEKWKKEILARSGPHVTFIDVESILAIVREIGGKILSVISLFLLAVSLFAFFSIVALFGRIVSIEEMKQRLYPLFGMSRSSVGTSLFLSRASIFILSFLLSLTIGIVAYSFMTRSSAFLTMTLGEVASVVGIVSIAYLVMILILRPKTYK